MREISLKKGEIMSCVYRTCRTINILDNCCCGLNVQSTCSTYCTRVCSQVTYTVTITNNCPSVVRGVGLHIPLDCAFCLDPTSVTVNGENVDITCLDDIQVGDLQPAQVATITYTVTVMERKRYIKTKALVTFYTCNSCTRKDLGVYSNCNLLQVCPCCACCETTTPQP